MQKWLDGRHQGHACKSKPATARRETVPLLDPRARVGYDYMARTRGIDPSLFEKYELGYATDGEYRNRVIFPVIQNGSPVYSPRAIVAIT